MAAGDLLIMIRGIAARTVSAVNDFIFGLKRSGMADDSIKRRVAEEILRGRIINEVSSFARVFIPGYSGEAVRRFGRDTVAERIKRMRAADFDRIDLIETPQMIRDREAAERRIVTEAYEDGEFLDVPEEPDQSQQFIWISIRNKNTCEECYSRHGQEATMDEWMERGLPRTSACYGGYNCNCDLVASEVLEPDDIPDELQVDPPAPRERFEWVVMGL
jgi:hypothetical protein